MSCGILGKFSTWFVTPFLPKIAREEKEISPSRRKAYYLFEKTNLEDGLSGSIHEISFLGKKNTLSEFIRRIRSRNRMIYPWRTRLAVAAKPSRRRFDGEIEISLSLRRNNRRIQRNYFRMRFFLKAFSPVRDLYHRRKIRYDSAKTFYWAFHVERQTDIDRDRY